MGMARPRVKKVSSDKIAYISQNKMIYKYFILGIPTSPGSPCTCAIDMNSMVDKSEIISCWIENHQKNCNETLNNDTREDEVHSTRQGLSNN